MLLKVFVEDKKGYIDTYENVNHVYIRKIDNKNHLEIFINPLEDKIVYPLKDITYCFALDMETLQEHFRYEK